MSKKQTHDPIPKGNQSKHAIEPQKREDDEDEQEQNTGGDKAIGGCC